MELSMFIPWTPTNKLREPKPETKPDVSGDLFRQLKTLLVNTLAPFPEAREALCLALLDFDRQWQGSQPDSRRFQTG